MFDRAACLAIRMAASPRVDTTALIALKTCLADASDAGLCGGPLSNASASGAGNSCNQNQGAARGHKYRRPPSHQADVKQLDLFGLPGAQPRLAAADRDVPRGHCHG